jgi:hypothetical protein
MVLLGTIFRVAQWAAAVPFWYDEYALASNVPTHDAAQIVGRLDRAVASPPAYLVLLRLLYEAFGGSERVLRLPSLVAGVAALVLFAGLARRTLGFAGAVVAVAALAFGDRMISHAAELKVYMIDCLVAVLFLWIAIGIRDKSTAWRAGVMSLLAAVAVWWSFPSIFVYTGLMLWLAPELRASRKGWSVTLAGGLAVLASQLVVYVINIRPQRVTNLVNAWLDSYVPWGHPLDLLPWLVRKLAGLAVYPGRDAVGVVLLVLAVAGTARLWRTGRRRTLLAPLLLPMLPTLVASALWLYPFGGTRATLFLVPGFLLLAGSGADAWRRFPNAKFAKAWWLAPAAIAAVTLGPNFYRLAVPRLRTPEVIPLSDCLAAHARPGDTIVVNCWDGPWEFTETFRRRTGTPFELVPSTPDNSAVVAPIPWKRFWVAGVFPQRAGGESRLRADVDRARKAAQEQEHYQGPGWAAYLFEARREATDPSSTRPTPP